LVLANSQTEPKEVAFHLYLTEILTIEEIRESYTLAVRSVDSAVEELMANLAEKGLANRTILIFTSDHGEGLGEHGEIGHITQLYDSMLHIPLIFHAPGLLPGGRVVEDPVGLVDVFPTLLDFLDARVALPFRGTSLLPAILEEDRAGRDYVYSETYPPEAPLEKHGVRTSAWKYIETREIDEREIYRLREDPGEIHNLLGESTPESRHMEKLLEEAGTPLSDEPPPHIESPVLDEGTAAKFRALGYIR